MTLAPVYDANSLAPCHAEYGVLLRCLCLTFAALESDSLIASPQYLRTLHYTGYIKKAGHVRTRGGIWILEFPLPQDIFPTAVKDFPMLILVLWFCRLAWSLGCSWSSIRSGQYLRGLLMDSGRS